MLVLQWSAAQHLKPLTHSLGLKPQRDLGPPSSTSVPKGQRQRLSHIFFRFITQMRMSAIPLIIPVGADLVSLCLQTALQRVDATLNLKASI